MKDLIVVGGPNGAGKTTFVRSYLQLRPLKYLSADDIAANLSPANPERVRIEAGREFSRRLRQSIDQGESVLVESTLSGRSLLHAMERARRVGYHVEIIFTFVEAPEICLSRIRERVRSGGHDVPEDDVRRRFYRSLRNFWSIYRQQASLWYLFYNGEVAFPLVAFQHEDQVDIQDQEYFSLYLAELERNDEHGKA